MKAKKIMQQIFFIGQRGLLCFNLSTSVFAQHVLSSCGIYPASSNPECCAGHHPLLTVTTSHASGPTSVSPSLTHPFQQPSGEKAHLLLALRAASLLSSELRSRFLNVNNELSHKYEKHLPAHSSELNAFNGKMTEWAEQEPSAEQRRARLVKKVSSPPTLA